MHPGQSRASKNAEGAYSKRLDVITEPDIPAGRTIWVFDQTDLREVKKRFTGWACFGGNVPSSLLLAGTPDQVKTHIKQALGEPAAVHVRSTFLIESARTNQRTSTRRFGQVFEFHFSQATTLGFDAFERIQFKCPINGIPERLVIQVVRS